MNNPTLHKGDRVTIVKGALTNGRDVTGESGTVQGLFPDGYNVTLDVNNETYYLDTPTLALTGESRVEPAAPTVTPKAQKSLAAVRSEAGRKAAETRRRNREAVTS